ncbi:ATP-binding protein [Nocardioides mesophilus]|uniref:ATP-binding protein n=1 Tax=Nocardioides mesophilus TaxID=433659 RepID=A0A7G9RBM6_9ACTN|nr:ATP-binding protein [Nocardioides mesophilus]QNN53001.1 ATP-binding protein [Nocardioides mesophilus]
MAGEYSVNGLAVPETLELLHQLLAEARVDYPDLSDVDAMLIETAVIEIAGNVVRHGRPTSQVVYAFTLRVLEDRVVGVLRHSGERVHWLPDAPMPDDPLAERGRGLALAEAALSDLRFDFEGGENVWTMVRLRESAPA